MTIMATLWQFMSRSDMTRDKMSQVLGAWGLGLGAWGFFSLFLIPDPLVINNRKNSQWIWDQYQWTRLSYSLGIILVSPIFYLPY